MKAKFRSLNAVVIGSLMATALLSSPAFSANLCSSVFLAKEKKLLELSLGVRQTGKESSPLALQIVDSRHQKLADVINNIATWAFGKALRLNAINEATKKFLADNTSDPYFVRLARAFDLKINYDDAAMMKNVPASGAAIVVLNHPRNGSDGIAVAAALSKIRPDTKVAMTLFLENVPGLAENAIFLNPYGGRTAFKYNTQRMIEMEDHLRKGGLVVIFASGEVSRKDPGSLLKPVDPEWKLGAARLLQAVPEAQVVPVYVGGEASPQFYSAQQKGGLRTTMMHVRELANNISHDFPISFSPSIPGKDLLSSFGEDMKSMMQYLRARTYLMHEQAYFQAKSEKTVRKMDPIAGSQDPALVHADLAKNGDLVFQDLKKEINVYAIAGSRMSDLVWHNLGIAREKSFRVVGEGSGKSMDIDSYDKDYHHIIAVDTKTNQFLGAYRVGRIDEIYKKKGLEGIYTTNFFEHRALIEQKGQQALELGRSFVDFEVGSKAIIALDRLWKGVTGFISLNPQYRYLIGPVSISNTYSTTSKLLMLKFLEERMDRELSPLIKGRTSLDFSSQFQAEINLVARNTPDLKELNRLVVGLDGVPIPPLLISYGKLGARYMAFDRDREFNTVDGLIMVDLLSPDAAEEAAKHFGDNWEAYLQFHSKK